MIPVSYADLAVQVRIDCACRLNRGDIKGAKNSAEIMRQAFFKVTESLINETDCGE